MTTFTERVVIVETAEQYEQAVKELEAQAYVSVDTETTGLEALELWEQVAKFNAQLEYLTARLERYKAVYKKRYKQRCLITRAKIADQQDIIRSITVERNAVQRKALSNPGGLSVHKNRTACLQVGTDHSVNNGVGTAYIIRPELVDSAWLNNYLNTRNELYMHNAKFDLKQLIAHLGVDLKGDNLVDTQAREYACTMGTGEKIGLDACLQKYCGIKKDGSVRLHNWSGPWSDEMISYAATDVLHLFDVARGQERHLDSKLMGTVWLEQDLSVALAHMELVGVGVDRALAVKAANQAEGFYNDLIQEVRDGMPGLENPNSNAQLLAHLRDVKGLSLASVDKKALKPYLELPYIKALMEMRKFYKVLGTYYKPMYENCLEQSDGTFRIYGNYNALRSAKSDDDAGTDTGRLSSSEPNLQNQPKNSRIILEDGSEVKLRAMFIPRPDYKLIVSDLDQIEPRILAYLSQDKELLRAFDEGIDPYCLMAEKMYGVPWQDVLAAHKAGNSAMRDDMKIALLSVMYLKTAFGLNRDYPQRFPTQADAARFLRDMDRNFLGVARWKKMCIRRAKLNGYAETVAGGRRLLPDINSNEKWKVEKSERQAVNFEIQGLAARGMKETLVLLRKRLVEQGLQNTIFPVLTVHDEVVLEVPDTPDMVALGSTLLEECMVEGTGQFMRAAAERPRGVAVTAKAKVVSSWAEAK